MICVLIVEELGVVVAVVVVDVVDEVVVVVVDVATADVVVIVIPELGVIVELTVALEVDCGCETVVEEVDARPVIEVAVVVVFAKVVVVIQFVDVDLVLVEVVVKTTNEIGVPTEIGRGGYVTVTTEPFTICVGRAQMGTDEMLYMELKSLPRKI